MYANDNNKEGSLSYGVDIFITKIFRLKLWGKIKGEKVELQFLRTKAT